MQYEELVLQHKSKPQIESFHEKNNFLYSAYER